MRHVVLAASLPVFLVLISLESRWVPFLIRYFMLPAVLTAPLLAILLRRRDRGVGVARRRGDRDRVHDHERPAEAADEPVRLRPPLGSHVAARTFAELRQRMGRRARRVPDGRPSGGMRRRRARHQRAHCISSTDPTWATGSCSCPGSEGTRLVPPGTPRSATSSSRTGSRPSWRSSSPTPAGRRGRSATRGRSTRSRTPGRGPVWPSGLAGDVARFLGHEHQARGRDRPQARPGP